MDHDVTKIKVGSEIELSILQGMPAHVLQQSDDMVEIEVSGFAAGDRADTQDSRLWIELFNDGSFLCPDFHFGDDLSWSLAG